MSGNVFLFLSKYVLVVSLKNLKQSFINNSYRLKEYIALESSKSALDKEDRSVSVYSPFLIFLFVVSVYDVFV